MPKSDGLKRLQALQYMKDKVLDGLTHEEVAKRRGVSRNTVERTLSWAQKAGIFIELEDALIQHIAPLAMEAVIHALKEEKNATVALEVLKGLNLLKRAHPITAKEVKDHDDLATYITQIRERVALEQETTDGQLIDAREPAGLIGTGALIPGYSPELLGASGEALGPIDGPFTFNGKPIVWDSKCERVGTGDPADAAEHDSGDSERVSDRDRGPSEEAASEKGQGGDEDRLSSDETARPDPPLGGGSGQNRF